MRIIIKENMKRIESELEKKISIPFGAIKSYWGLNEGLDFKT